MVSGRSGLKGGVTNGSDRNDHNYPDDVESNRNGRAKPRFKDTAGDGMDDGRRVELRHKLQEGLKGLNVEKFRKSDDQLKEIKNKKVRKFYETQNQRLNDWLEVDSLVKAISDDVIESFDPQDTDNDGIPEPVGGLTQSGNEVEPFLPDEEREKRRKGKRNARWAINVNVLANIALLAAKAFAATSSSSLSLIASLIDSALDLLCTLIIYTTNRLVQWKIKGLGRRFPIGRKRLEPIGILVFSIIMVIAFLQVLQESVKKLLPDAEHKTTQLPTAAIAALAGTVIVKGIIWIGCARVDGTQVKALSQDCKTDVYFNTLSLLFPLIGSKFDIWWLDPVGAALLSLYIIYDWTSTCVENVSRLTGIGVDDDVQKKLMYLAWRFSPVVNGYKSLTAYHAGDGVWVEVDLLLDENTPLEHVHDVSETLQYCMEGLNEVDRAFVSVDYATHGPTGHITGE